MSILPPPSDLNQYITWKSIPGDPKPRKVPVNYQTGKECNAHDAQNWTDYNTAAGMVSVIGATGVGFVITTADPMVCIDLDNCLQSDNTWSPFALEILAQFPGAYVEISHSGRGLHIWFQGHPPAGHQTRGSEAPGLEVYSSGRFIALGTQGQGDPNVDHNIQVNALLKHHLPGTLAESAEWTDEPVAEWNGPTDDDELIRKMLASKPSAAAVFGDGATVRDLWEGDADKLGDVYPSESGDAFNHSSADMALMAHLAFWTGKDCARMDRLFRQSGLMRGKWDRDGYSHRTTTRACSGDGGVYTGGKAAAPVEATQDNASSKPIKATPYILPDVATIPRRQWIYGYVVIRKYVSLVVAPGATGKSALLIADALALVTGRNLIGVLVSGGPKKVWVWNLEDPSDELNRRFVACCQHYQISGEDIGDRLFVDSGRDQTLCIAKQTKSGVEIIEPVVLELVEELKARQIDVLIVDPFVSSHTASENDNTAMDAVAKTWGRVAELANCGVVLVHHVRKLGGEQASAESARGASALVAAARSVRIASPMTPKNAGEAGLDTHKGYFQVFDDKNNLAPADENATWFHIASVALSNGDSVGVIEPWTWPNAFAGVTQDDLLAVQEAVASKRLRENSQADDWVGYAVGEVLNVDAATAFGRKRVKSLVKTLLENGTLIKVLLPDKNGKLRPCIDVGKQPG